MILKTNSHTAKCIKSAVAFLALSSLAATTACKDPEPLVPEKEKEEETTTTTTTTTETEEDARCNDTANYACNVASDLQALCAEKKPDNTTQCNSDVWPKYLFDEIVAIQTGGDDTEVTECTTQVMYVNTQWEPLNFRSSPEINETNYVDLVDRGQAVTCVGIGKTDPTWTKVKIASGTEGWMSSQYLSTAVPVGPTYTPPATTGGTPTKVTPQGTGPKGKCTYWGIRSRNVEDKATLGGCNAKNGDRIGAMLGLNINETAKWYNCTPNGKKWAVGFDMCICDVWDYQTKELHESECKKKKNNTFRKN